MIRAECIDRCKDNSGNIIAYRLRDCNGHIADFSADEVKRALANNELVVVNLKMTSDGRIIQRTFNLRDYKLGDTVKTEYFKYTLIELNGVIGWKLSANQKQSKFECEAVYKGYPVISLEEAFINYNNSTIDLSGMDVRYIISINSAFNKSWVQRVSFRGLNFENLIYMESVFNESKVKEVDFGDIDTTKVETICALFCRSEIQRTNIQNFRTPRLRNMCGAFAGCKLDIIDLRKWDVSNVEDISECFRWCEHSTILIDGLQFKNLKDMNGLFHSATISNISMRNFNSKALTQVKSVFEQAKVHNLDLKGWDLCNVTNLDNLFAYCTIDKIDFTGVNITKVTQMNEMFRNCKAGQIIGLSNLSGCINFECSLMFLGIQVDKLKPCLDFAKCNRMKLCFKGARINELDLSGVRFPNKLDYNAEQIFNESNIKLVITSESSLEPHLRECGYNSVKGIHNLGQLEQKAAEYGFTIGRHFIIV